MSANKRQAKMEVIHEVIEAARLTSLHQTKAMAQTKSGILWTKKIN